MDHSVSGGLGHCTDVKDATLRAIMVWRERDLVSFFSLSGPYAGVVKRVASVGGGSRNACTLFFILITLRNRKESSRTFRIKAKGLPIPNQLFVVFWFRGE